jgi:cell division septum initiation protein DivIVA
VWGDVVDSLLDRIAGRRAELAEQAERLRKELAEVEAELARVGTAEQVVAQLLASQDDEAGGERERVLAGQRPAPLVVPQRASGAGAEDLPPDYRQLLQIVAEEGAGGQAVACKRVSAKLGLTARPRHTETVRGKLKRLAARGWLAEVAPGRFAVRP